MFQVYRYGRDGNAYVLGVYQHANEACERATLVDGWFRRIGNRRPRWTAGEGCVYLDGPFTSGEPSPQMGTLAQEGNLRRTSRLIRERRSRVERLANLVAYLEETGQELPIT